jgi:hypothetical protein
MTAFKILKTPKHATECVRRVLYHQQIATALPKEPSRPTLGHTMMTTPLIDSQQQTAAIFTIDQQS